jgi:hypothetical protein
MPPPDPGRFRTHPRLRSPPPRLPSQPDPRRPRRQIRSPRPRPHQTPLLPSATQSTHHPLPHLHRPRLRRARRTMRSPPPPTMVHRRTHRPQRRRPRLPPPPPPLPRRALQDDPDTAGRSAPPPKMLSSNEFRCQQRRRQGPLRPCRNSTHTLDSDRAQTFCEFRRRVVRILRASRLRSAAEVNARTPTTSVTSRNQAAGSPIVDALRDEDEDAEGLAPGTSASRPYAM